jgi:hypothetical protein
VSDCLDLCAGVDAVNVGVAGNRSMMNALAALGFLAHFFCGFAGHFTTSIFAISINA